MIGPATLAKCRKLVEENRLAEAEPLLRKAPDHAGAANLLGILLAKMGRFEEADDRLTFALANDPENLETLTWLAAVRKTRGLPQEALAFIQVVVERQPTNAKAYDLLGSCQLALGQVGEAEAAFRTSIRLAPVAGTFANLGMALRLLNRGDEAVDAFRQAIDLAPTPNHFFQLFKQYQRLSRWKESEETLRDGLSRHPDSIQLSEALAAVLGRLGKADEAEAIFRKIAPLNAGAANSYATWLQEEGRFDDSVSVLRTSLRLQPLQGAPYRNLAEAKHFSLEGEPILQTALRLYEDPRMDTAGRMHLAFALGRIYEHEHDYESAMRWFDTANETGYQLYPTTRTFDPEWTRREPERVAELFSEDFFARAAPFGSVDSRPIFIVGMIRSGTTLLDQIVSSHPEVVATGEGAFWTAESTAIHARWEAQTPTPEEIASLAKAYLDATPGAEGEIRFTDKMPLNYRNLGPIHSVFPNARILHIRRDPLDTCLSMYTTFLAGSANFLYRKENLVAFYRAYLRTMEHWRRVLPADRFLELDYESLVASPERETRRVLEFLDLPWDEACLHHDRHGGAIGTPSRWQARQPVYGTSVARWRRYEPWLGKLLELQYPH